MKRGINKYLRMGLMGILVILLGVCSFSLYKEVRHPRLEEQKTSLYTYANKIDINYNVLLKPNILYEQKVIEQNSTYITEFVESIAASYNYNYTGDRIAEIKGDYDILGKIEGFTERKEETLTIWQKDFVLLPKKSFNVKEKNYHIKEDIQINFNEFNNFAKQVIETSKISSNAKLTIFMNINLNAITDKGTIEEKFSPSIVIPLNTGYFTITGNLQEEKLGGIEETKEVQIPVNKNIIILYASILIILLVALLLLVFFTKEKTIDPLEKKLKKIFKKHGDRMVALNSEFAVSSEYYSQVKSMDDLVRIADEIGKPIMYTYSSDYRQISKFYVVDKDYVYTLNLNDSLNQTEVCEVSNAKEQKLLESIR